jgi:osmotically-inducible protein OsmY
MTKLFLLFFLLNSLFIGACSTLPKDDQEINANSQSQDRRTRKAIQMDKDIEDEAYSELSSDEELSSQCHYKVTAYNGAVLVTGEAPNEELKNKIISIVQGIANVKIVHNHLIIGYPSYNSSRTNDQFITDSVEKALNQIRTMPDFDPSMVKVITENNTVYLMGIVHRDEGTIVINVTRLQPGINQIITIFEYLD